ncbi:putative recQ-mediated genome instability protein 1 [Paratrimastix pyriformis]|uniref:RecQ-mediated genome instability protein 1 n=1 Tax=Paratrimastix pyriformis TaxID=342808 RepID=A0ABQ8UV22_9EUKA|nr:putative recQ-mediated genome instability protein 1 [Paratrimastix pyriformis]
MLGTLRQRNILVKPEWLEQCTAFLHSLTPPPTQASMLDLVVDQFLHSDMHLIATPSLPPNVAALHGQVLQGTFILQIDEVIDVAAPLSQRYPFHLLDATTQPTAPSTGVGRGRAIRTESNRLLKVALTDGTQMVGAMELRLVPALKLDIPSGTKVLLTNPLVRRGLLMLVPDCTRVLGGSVQQLNARRTEALKKLQDQLDPHAAEVSLLKQRHKERIERASPQLQQAPYSLEVPREEASAPGNGDQGGEDEGEVEPTSPPAGTTAPSGGH